MTIFRDNMLFALGTVLLGVLIALSSALQQPATPTPQIVASDTTLPAPASAQTSTQQIQTPIQTKPSIRGGYGDEEGRYDD